MVLLRGSLRCAATDPLRSLQLKCCNHMRLRNKTAVSMGGGLAEVQKKLRKQMYLAYRCIPNCNPHRNMFSEKYFRYPYPFGLASNCHFWSYSF